MIKTNSRKAIFSVILLAVFLIPCLLLLTACGGGKPEAKVDASIANVEGITVTLEKTTRKEFKEGEDSATRVEQFAQYGELDQINVLVSGTVSKADCDANATAMDSEGNPVVDGSDTPINYYTDFFELQLLIPDGATMFLASDGLPAKPVAEIENVENGYVIVETQWLLGNPGSWNICGNAETQDGYFYYSFIDDSGEVVDEFFVRVAYDVEFVD